MIESLTKYFGIDLLATALVLLGVYFLSEKQRKGFLIGSIGNVLWIIYGIWTASAGLVIVNTVITVMYVRGYLNWGRDSEEHSSQRGS